MMKFNRLTFTLTLMLVATIVANAQQRRNVTSGYNTLVYEYESVDTRPQFPGGETGLINFINETREYPYNAYRNHIQGRVLCSFIVGTDGKLFDIQVIRSSGNESLDREAMRVISKMPRWVVGKVGNTKVNVRCVLPIAFRL
ncbi:MAG: energy transducer TonB [Muribaculaceae bacterium]|nr:energy transducer TonB [Muribaculaceae bacterium]MBR6432496.1 energy transducer TonB [Muribaculaceae bacterium]